MEVFKPGVNPLKEVVRYREDHPEKFFLFLGGAIDMGEAENWQDEIAHRLSGIDDLVIINPRRDDWDLSWKQDPIPGTKFYEQVKWEMVLQDLADSNLYYFTKDSKAPITLLELGLYGGRFPNETIVCCPREFYRYGNVAMVCKREGIDLTHSMDEAILEIERKVRKF